MARRIRRVRIVLVHANVRKLNFHLESNTDNNTRVVAVNAATDHDAVVRRFAASSRTIEGGRVRFTATTENLGTGPVKLPSVAYYLSRDREFSSEDRLLARSSERYPRSDNVWQSQAVASLPSEVAAGRYFVIARANPDGDAFENNTENNFSAARPLWVEPRALASVTLTGLAERRFVAGTFTLSTVAVNETAFATGPIEAVVYNQNGGSIASGSSRSTLAPIRQSRSKFASQHIPLGFTRSSLGAMASK